MVKQDQAILQINPLSIHSLYDAYGGMLLGYIFEIVEDQKVAEDYLVKTFSRIAENFDKVNWSETNKWVHLQRFAKDELAGFYKALQGCEIPVGNVAYTLPNKYLDEMTDEQRRVFCNTYYSKKTTAQLAAELNKPEIEIKLLLKEAFAVIRKSNGR